MTMQRRQPCGTCRKPTASMRTDDTRCERCSQPYPASGVGPAAVREAGTLFDGPAPFQRHSATSKAAALGLENLTGKRAGVLLWLVEHGPATDNALIAALASRGWSPNTPRARRVELHQAGYVTEAGERDGSTLWEATDAGRKALAAWDAQERAA